MEEQEDVNCSKTGLLISDMEVTGKVDNPDELILSYPFTVPFFDL